MPTVSNATFGPLISYLVPGAVVLAGLSGYSPAIAGWLSAAPGNEPTIGGFLYLTLAALAAGMTVSAVRWAVVGNLHAWTGLRLPPLDFTHLGPNVEAFRLLINIHYDHYLFYSNMLIACAVAFIAYRLSHGPQMPVGWPEALFVALEGVFWLTSRDTIWKYHTRAAQLLRAPEDVAAPPRRHSRTAKRGGGQS